MKILTSVLLVVLFNLCAADRLIYYFQHYPNIWPKSSSIKLLILHKETSECLYITDPDIITNFMVKRSKSDEIVVLKNQKDLEAVRKLCRVVVNSSEYKKPVQNAAPYITFPGTLWCGPGHHDVEYDDLGTERETDMCCRDHDHCENIKSGQTKNNLTNTSPFTRVLCKCEPIFEACLQQAKTLTAAIVGEFYFNLAQNQCYDLDHPIVKCSESPRIGNCNKYALDESQPKIWQFFQPRQFKNIL